LWIYFFGSMVRISQFCGECKKRVITQKNLCSGITTNVNNSGIITTNANNSGIITTIVVLVQPTFDAHNNREENNFEGNPSCTCPLLPSRQRGLNNKNHKFCKYTAYKKKLNREPIGVKRIEIAIVLHNCFSFSQNYHLH